MTSLGPESCRCRRYYFPIRHLPHQNTITRYLPPASPHKSILTTPNSAQISRFKHIHIQIHSSTRQRHFLFDNTFHSSSKARQTKLPISDSHPKSTTKHQKETCHSSRSVSKTNRNANPYVRFGSMIPKKSQKTDGSECSAMQKRRNYVKKDAHDSGTVMPEKKEGKDVEDEGGKKVVTS